MRFYLLYNLLRTVLSRTPFPVIIFYARSMAFLRLMPGLGVFLESQVFLSCVMCDVSKMPAESALRYMNGVLTTPASILLNALAHTNISITNQRPKFVRWLG